MAHLDICPDCMQSFVSKGWAAPMEGRQYVCAPEGLQHLADLEVVSYCPADGMPIYRRWIESGIATESACPYCLGREDEMFDWRHSH
jgi:hypothetical protein